MIPSSIGRRKGWVKVSTIDKRSHESTTKNSISDCLPNRENLTREFITSKHHCHYTKQRQIVPTETPPAPSPATPSISPFFQFHFSKKLKYRKINDFNKLYGRRGMISPLGTAKVNILNYCIFPNSYFPYIRNG